MEKSKPIPELESDTTEIWDKDEDNLTSDPVKGAEDTEDTEDTEDAEDTDSTDGEESDISDKLDNAAKDMESDQENAGEDVENAEDVDTADEVESTDDASVETDTTAAATSSDRVEITISIDVPRELFPWLNKA